MFQGDSLNLPLFCMSFLPLSVELRTVKGYLAGPPNKRNIKVGHLFHMDVMMSTLYCNYVEGAQSCSAHGLGVQRGGNISTEVRVWLKGKSN